MNANEKLSTIERRHQAAERRESKTGAVPVVAIQQQPALTPEEQTHAKRAAAARELPDSMFEDDGEVQHLRAVYEALAALTGNQRLPVRNWLKAEEERLTARAKAAEQAVMWAVFEDAANRDSEFSKASNALAEIERGKALAAAIARAHQLVSSGDPNQQRLLYDATAKAHEALLNRLFALKLEHVAVSCP